MTSRRLFRWSGFAMFVAVVGLAIGETAVLLVGTWVCVFTAQLGAAAALQLIGTEAR